MQIRRYKFLNIPFIRGIFILIDSLIVGIKTLNYSASFFEEDEEIVMKRSDIAIIRLALDF